MKNSSFIRLLRVAVLLLVSAGAFSQGTVSADLLYMQAFQGKEISLWKVDVSEYQAPGFSGHLFYTYSFERPSMDVQVGLGAQHFFFSGTAGEESFTGTTTRLDLMLKGIYRFDDHWKAGVGFGLENNRDFGDFRTGAAENFRYNGIVDVQYQNNSKWGVVLRYYILMYPDVDVYLLTNPAHKAGIGVMYNLWKS